MAAPTAAIIKPFCHSENDKKPKTVAENNRADAKTATAILNADRFPPAGGGEPDEVASCTGDMRIEKMTAGTANLPSLLCYSKRGCSIEFSDPAFRRADEQCSPLQ